MASSIPAVDLWISGEKTQQENPLWVCLGICLIPPNGLFYMGDGWSSKY